MSYRIARRAAAFAGLVAVTAVSISATRAPLRGVSYRLRMNTRLPSIMQGLQQNGGPAAPAFLVKVKAAGKNARFEFDSMPQGTPIPVGDYMLFLESGRAIRVSPKEKLYDEAPNGFGAAGGGLQLLNQVGGRGGGRAPDITGIDMDLQQLDDETIQGRQVRHYQLVAEFMLDVLNQTTPVRIEMETWTADLPPNQVIVNPFDLTGAVASNDPASKLTNRLMAERKKMQGTPIKMNTTFVVQLANGAVPQLEFGQSIEVLDIKDVDLDPKELDVPAGYTKREPGQGRGRGNPPALPPSRTPPV